MHKFGVLALKFFAKLDLFGICFLITGCVCIFLPISTYFSPCLFVLSIACFFRSFYEMKADLWTYKKAIRHYKSILSTATDSWIAWDRNGQMIGISKNFKDQFDFENINNISLDDILNKLVPSNIKNIEQNISDLVENGAGFSVVVNTSDHLSKLELTFSKVTNKQTETILIWCRNITAVSSTLENLKNKLENTTNQNNILNRILDNLPIPVWYRNADLKIAYCNNMYSNIVDSSKETILKNNIPLVAGNIFGQGHSLAEMVKKAGKKQSICHSTIVSGSRKKLDITEVPFSSDMLGFAIDNTNLEEAINNLDKVIKTQADVLETLPTAIAIFNQNMRLIYFNSAYEKLNNFEEIWLNSNPLYGEILDKKRICRLIPEYADFVGYKQEQIQMFTTLISQKQDLLYLPNGSVLRRTVSPYPLGGLMFLYDDITDSLTLKRENKTLLAVQKETINNLIEGISVFGSDNRLRFINPSMLKLWNINNDIKEYIHISEFAEYILQGIDYIGEKEIYKSNIISNFTDRIMKTGRLLKKDGSVIFFSYTPLSDGSHLHSYVDVTATCQVELALYEKEQAINISNQLKHKFISNISSEIRNPINIITGFAELLNKQYFGQLNEKQFQYCDGILNATKEITSLVTNMKLMNDTDISKITINKEVFDLNKLILEVINLLLPEATSHNIKLECVKTLKSFNMYADKQLLKQIQINIITNLINFLSNNSEIKISLIDNEKSIKIVTTVADASSSNHTSKIKVFQRMSFKRIAKATLGEQINLGIPTIEPLIKKHGGKIEVIKNGPITIICTFDKEDKKEDLTSKDKAA